MAQPDSAAQKLQIEHLPRSNLDKLDLQILDKAYL